MPSPYLTKSDFKASFDCRTKLFYRKNSYPSNTDENAYMKFLADGGFMIELVAKARYPDGIDLSDESNPQKLLDSTRELINGSQNVVLFEAAALHGKFYARIDILRREGEKLHLIEVKSSSLRSDDEDSSEDDDDDQSPFMTTKGKVATKWRPYLLDVAFQAHVLRLTFPSLKVVPWLCVIDKAHVVTANETLGNFRLSRDPSHPKARPEVVYSGDRSKLKNSGLLMMREVSAETDFLMPEVVEKANVLGGLIGQNGQVTRVQEAVADVYKICRKCEYRFGKNSSPTTNGFNECWKEMAQVEPHILDLHQVTRIGTTQNPDPVPPLLAAGNASLLDLAVEQLGNEGSLRDRRLLQWTHSAHGGMEHLSNELQVELNSHSVNPGWPKTFIDFEACNVALPHHTGLSPYERVAFQWSCHTLTNEGNLLHTKWLNTERQFPNFKFAESLRKQIGTSGTVYVWSAYEQSTLVKVLSQIEKWVKRDSAEALRVSGFKEAQELSQLADWIDDFLGPEDKKGKRHPARFRDLHKLALKHYFHPLMLGRTSIKLVLPAVWHQSARLREHGWFKKYLKCDAEGSPMDPYKTLPPLKLADGSKETVISDGTGAIRIYQDLIFQNQLNPEFRKNCEQLLLQYCELDTAAMVMIWKHWIGF